MFRGQGSLCGSASSVVPSMLVIVSDPGSCLRLSSGRVLRRDDQPDDGGARVRRDLKAGVQNDGHYSGGVGGEAQLPVVPFKDSEGVVGEGPHHPGIPLARHQIPDGGDGLFLG